MEELASAAKRLYDLMDDGRYVLIRFEKWARIVKASRYILNESKVLFADLMWSPCFEDGDIELRIETKDVGYVEEKVGVAGH